MQFDYDERKSRANQAQDGIDFVVIGRIADKHWSAVVTYRGEAIRLISVRRSRSREVEAYEGE